MSNDDGVFAPGLAILADQLKKIAEIRVIAPTRDRSGASNSLTLDRPLRVQIAANGFMMVDGTPTDCVHLALTGFLDALPDMVIAGINKGANLGDDVFYSGTVAAAYEGRWLGASALAVSLVCSQETMKSHFETAAKVSEQLFLHLRKAPLQSNIILNVNVPDVPYDQLKGLEMTRLGHRHPAESVFPAKDPYDRTVYWIGPAGVGDDAGPGTDFYAISQGRVSVTPLLVDLTRHESLNELRNWAQGILL